MHARTCLATVVLLSATVGCETTPAGSEPVTPVREESAFGPTSMRLHPVFTRVKDWTGDGQADGVEAMVEFQDAFGDPAKAAGRIIFELYDYRAGQPDPRGPRVANPWVGALLTLQDQRDRWNRASRTYTFPLMVDGVEPVRSYVLTTQFDGNDGRRFFDRMIIEGRRVQAAADAPPVTRPARE